MSQMKEQGKITERELKERKICKTPMVINLLIELEKRVEDLSENLNWETENKEPETKNSITEMKKTLDGINNRLEEAEEWISDLKESWKAIKLNRREKNNNK